MTCLHGMFLAMLRARKLKDDECGVPFLPQTRNDKRDTYPWYEL